MSWVMQCDSCKGIVDKQMFRCVRVYKYKSSGDTSANGIEEFDLCQTCYTKLLNFLKAEGLSDAEQEAT